jgi:hypothetical protein
MQPLLLAVLPSVTEQKELVAQRHWRPEEQFFVEVVRVLKLRLPSLVL